MHDHIRLGFNIDHIATLRNARGGSLPDPVAGAMAAQTAGVHGITAHLREDRRHIRDEDMERVKAAISVPLNFEMAATDEMVAIARRIRPNACCLVPENRMEVTTEGGLDVAGGGRVLIDKIAAIKDFDARVSLFVDPTVEAVEAAAHAGADIVELHSGELAHAYAANLPGRNGQAGQTGHTGLTGQDVARELARLTSAAQRAHALGVEVHAGHGLNYETAQMVSAIAQMQELNIGHFLVGEAVMLGLPKAIEKMLGAIDAGQNQAA